MSEADLLRSCLIVFALARLLYQTFWKPRPSGIAPAIQAWTSRS
jgi:hypothetical protein